MNHMKRETNTNHRRINITLPQKTVELIDRVCKKGNRSRLIDEAVRDYLTKTSRAVLRNQIRSVDTQRLIRRLGTLTSDTMRRVDQALMISLGLVEL